MKGFEDDLLQAVKSSICRQLHNQDFMKIGYEERIKLPADFLEKAWELVDKNRILEQLSKRLELELIDRLVNSIASELATDIKQVLSNKERREAVRAVVRENLDQLTGKK